MLVGAADLPARTHLAAFLVMNGATTTAMVRRWTTERLPPMMRPTRLLAKPSLPRTAAGKVDRPLLADEYDKHAR